MNHSSQPTDPQTDQQQKKPPPKPRSHAARVFNAILRAGTLSASEKMILLAYAWHVGAQDSPNAPHYVWPGCERLALLSGLYVRTVRRIRKRLLKRGLLREVEDWRTESQFEGLSEGSSVPWGVDDETVFDFIRHRHAPHIHPRQRRRGHPRIGRPTMCVEIMVKAIEALPQAVPERPRIGNAPKRAQGGHGDP